MGFKVRDSNAVLPASLNAGVFTVYAGLAACKIQIPIKTITFEKQCNFFVSVNLVGYLVNKEYALLLWEDGRGCIIQKEKKVLVKNFSYDLDKLPYCNEVLSAGVLRTLVGTLTIVNYIKELITNTDIIYAVNMPLVVVLDKGKNDEYLQIINRRASNLQPVMESLADTNMLVYYYYNSGQVPVYGVYHISVGYMVV